MNQVTSDKVFEVIGVYFANSYWNNIYNLASDYWRDEKYDKLIDAYKYVLGIYSRGFCTQNGQNGQFNNYYNRIVKDIYINYKDFLQTSDTFLNFIDVVTKYLLPTDYYKSLSSYDPKKENIFKRILTKTVMKFTIYISQYEIQNVVDKKLRIEKRYIVNWKNKFIDILTQEKNEFCALLLAQNSGINITNDDIPQIPKMVCDKLQISMKKLIQEKSQLIHDKNKLIEYIKVLKKIIEDSSKSPAIQRNKKRIPKQEPNEDAALNDLKEIQYSGDDPEKPDSNELHDNEFTPDE